MHDHLCTLLYNTPLQPGYFRLGLERRFEFTPGQFCMVRIPNQAPTLLRRPFSLCQDTGEAIELVYKAVGPMTRALSQLQAGAKVQILAPLGHGLEWHGAPRVIGIAGGYGIAPMLGLGRILKTQQIPYEVYYGARSQNDILLAADFKALDIPLHVSTEDGSLGFKGRILDLIKQHEAKSSAETLSFACGPHGLLHASAQWAQQQGVRCQVSLEEYMGCGIGVCLGCVVKDKEQHYRRSCVDGPVFAAEELTW